MPGGLHGHMCIWISHVLQTINRSLGSWLLLGLICLLCVTPAYLGDTYDYVIGV